LQICPAGFPCRFSLQVFNRFGFCEAANIRARHVPYRPVWPGAHEYALNENYRNNGGNVVSIRNPIDRITPAKKEALGSCQGLEVRGRPNTPSTTGAQQRRDAARGPHVDQAGRVACRLFSP
jgi:hypothetical protein